MQNNVMEFTEVLGRTILSS